MFASQRNVNDVLVRFSTEHHEGMPQVSHDDTPLTVNRYVPPDEEKLVLTDVFPSTFSVPPETLPLPL